MYNLISCFSAFIVIFPLTSGLYFHIGETERKCFIEELPDETTVLGKHKLSYSFLVTIVY